jgi:hypothetical protein
MRKTCCFNNICFFNSINKKNMWFSHISRTHVSLICGLYKIFYKLICRKFLSKKKLALEPSKVSYTPTLFFSCCVWILLPNYSSYFLPFLVLLTTQRGVFSFFYGCTDQPYAQYCTQHKASRVETWNPEPFTQNLGMVLSLEQTRRRVSLFQQQSFSK